MHPVQQKLAALAAAEDISGLSLRALAARVGVTNAQTIKYHLGRLAVRGGVPAVPAAPAGQAALACIPLYGSASCGPATAFADGYEQGSLRISRKLLEPGLLARLPYVIGLEASGDSMDRAEVGAGRLPIRDGDYVLVDTSERSLPPQGAYVASIIDGAANIKMAVPDPAGGRIELLSESSRYHPPILLHASDAFYVAGRVAQVVPRGGG